MIIRQIVEKERVVGLSPAYYENNAYLKVLQSLDINKAYNIQTSRVKLTPHEVDDIAERHKRADGQYFYYGNKISREVLCKKIYEDCYVFQIKVVEIENTHTMKDMEVGYENTRRTD